LAGPNQRAKLDLLREAAGRLGRRLLLIDLDRLAQSEISWTEAILLSARTARLRDALPVWTRGEPGGCRSPEAQGSPIDDWVRALAAMDIQTGILCTAELRAEWAMTADRSFIRLEFPLPDSRSRSSIWARQLKTLGLALDIRETALLAETFRLDAEGIDRAAARAVALAHWRDLDHPRPGREDLLAGARAEAARVLPRYATRLTPAYEWDDIVLPPDQFRQLEELCERVRHRGMVLNEWGFSRRLPLGTGIAALFAGPSGAGKTMAAQVVAAALGGLDLYRVEIPAVVSKYIGETEKALEQVFREAEGTSAILFFDEADALFGRRTEVKDAHDRYANIEVSYLLQALEAYDGLTILATNFQHNLDDAFVRRLAFIVNFPYPEEAERRAIWQRCWPVATPLSSDLDVAYLAQFKLTGGDIRNAALSAAFAAAADGGRVTMPHIVRGIRREYQKLGRACADSDFGTYVAAVQNEGRR
jgi:SpoVK/Ycf46/Vps4 family AAA+-type ATPase